MAAQQVGTGFTNLSQIVNANQNNQLGSSIYSGVQNTVNQTNQDVNNAENSFQTQANAANTNTAANQANATNTINSALNDPNSISSNQGNDLTGNIASTFQNYESGNYTGPSQLSNYSGLQNEGANVAQLGQEASTQGGQYDLLKQYVGGNQNYTQGEQNLDSLVLGQTGSGDLQKAAQATQGVQQGITQAGNNAQAYANQIALGNKAFAQNVTGQIQGAQGTIENQLNSTISADQAANQATQNQLANIDAGLSGEALANANASTNGQVVSTGIGSADQQLQSLLSSGLLSPTQLAQLQTVNAYNDLVNEGINYNNYASNTLTPYQKQLQSGDAQQEYDASLLAATGNQSNAGLSNYDQDLANALTYTGPQNLTQQGVANSQQQASMNALALLGGQTPTFETVGNYQAGGANLNTGALAAETQQNLTGLSNNMNYNTTALQNAIGISNARLANKQAIPTLTSDIAYQNNLSNNLSQLQQLINEYNANNNATNLTGPSNPNQMVSNQT